MTAPKIDTQAPRIGMTVGVDFATGKDTTMLTLKMGDKVEFASANSLWGRAMLDLLAERDLAEARAAAAAQAMREAVLAWRDNMKRDHPGNGIAYAYFTQCANSFTDADASAALDRLIAERVDEMWRACLDALPEMGPEPVYPGWVLKTFIDNMKAIRAHAARGSKEGRDG